MKERVKEKTPEFAGRRPGFKNNNKQRGVLFAYNAIITAFFRLYNDWGELA